MQYMIAKAYEIRTNPTTIAIEVEDRAGLSQALEGLRVKAEDALPNFVRDFDELSEECQEEIKNGEGHEWIVTDDGNYIHRHDLQWEGPVDDPEDAISEDNEISFTIRL